MAHHTILFAEKNLKKLIVYAGTNGIYRNIDTSGNYEKIYNYVKANASKTELIFSKICCRGDRKGVMNEVKTLNKKIEEFCKSKNLALIRHSDVNQNCLEKKKLHLHEKEISTLAISFKKFLLNEWQQNFDLGVGSDKITADHNLTNQRQNISQNVPENLDRDLKKLKVWRVENDSNPIVAYLNINSLGEKINHLCEICKESPMDIPCVDETKIDTSYPDDQFQINDYQFPPSRRDRNKFGGGKIAFMRQGLITRRLPKFETKVSETICVELTIYKQKWST